jgi:hypothetical protein
VRAAGVPECTGRAPARIVDGMTRRIAPSAPGGAQRRRFVLAASSWGLAASLGVPASALAQAGFPSRPLKIVVAFPPGGHCCGAERSPPGVARLGRFRAKLRMPRLRAMTLTSPPQCRVIAEPCFQDRPMTNL